MFSLFNSQFPFIMKIIQTPEGKVNLGTVHFYSDYFYYLSQIIQGKSSWFYSTILYTSENLRPVLVGWQSVFAGKILTSLGLSVIASYQLLVLLYLLLFIIFSYKVISHIFPDNWGKRVLSLFLFISSTSMPLIKWTQNGIEWSYFSYWYNLGNSVARFGPTPHHLLASASFAFMIICLNYWLNGKSGKIRAALGLILGSIILAGISPVQWGLITLASFLSVTSFALTNNMSFRAHGTFLKEISSVNEVVHPVKFHQKFLHGRNLLLPKIPPRLRWPSELVGMTNKQLLPILFIFFSGLPVALYVKQVFAMPPYSYSSAWEATQQVNVDLWTLFLGSGLVIPLGLTGMKSYLEKRNYVRIFGLVLVLTASVFYFSHIPPLLSLSNVRFWPSVLYIFWSAAAAEGIFYLGRIFPKYKKIAIGAIISIYILSISPTYILQFKESVKPQTNEYFYIPKEANEAFRQTETIAREKSVFLVERPYNEIFPALTGRRSFSGFRFFTIDSEEKDKKALAFFGGKMTSDEMRNFLAVNKIEYVFGLKDNEFTSKSPMLKEIYGNNLITIYGFKE